MEPLDEATQRRDELQEAYEASAAREKASEEYYKATPAGGRDVQPDARPSVFDVEVERQLP
eukprot:4266271-Pyramimonas_sp.AAC.1